MVPGFFSPCYALPTTKSARRDFKRDWEWCSGSARCIDTERRGANGSHHRAATFGLKLFFNKGSGSPAGGRLFFFGGCWKLAGWLTRGRRPPPPHRLLRFFFFVCIFFFFFFFFPPLYERQPKGANDSRGQCVSLHTKHNTRRFFNKNEDNYSQRKKLKVDNNKERINSS